MTNQEIIDQLGNAAQQAYRILGSASLAQKNQALTEAAKLIKANQQEILKANLVDQKIAEQAGRDKAFIDRLILNEARISSMAEALEEIAKLPDPVGKITYDHTRPNGLNIKRVTVPLGVIAIIYESRPNVTSDAWALCLKAGNAAILRPGSESFNSASVIVKLLKQALSAANLPEDAIAILPNSERDLVNALLKADNYIDVVVPRGGKNLIKAVTEQSNIAIFKHLDGNCHSYIHAAADLEKALEILYNAKLRRTGICGATESVVVDAAIAAEFIPLLIAKFANQAEIRTEEGLCQKYPELKLATQDDFYAEYLDNIMSLKIVDNITAAIAHINEHSSKHTEAIITEDTSAATEFLNNIDSAIVMHNASTQFADGGEFGLGAEIGIATGRLHARGPVGLEQLVTYKYQVLGKDHIRG